MRRKTVILSLVLAKLRLPHCFQPVDKPLDSRCLYKSTLDLVSFTCAKLGLKTPMSPDECQVVPPPTLKKYNKTIEKYLLI
jgi:hypothetical protein